MGMLKYTFMTLPARIFIRRVRKSSKVAVINVIFVCFKTFGPAGRISVKSYN
jgi:hypothetical protein